MVNVLFVCSGNICRSPLAQGVFEDLLRREGLKDEITTDSAGTYAFYHLGDPPDPRACQSAAERGLDIGSQRARMIESEDCESFDYLLVMDRGNYENVRDLCRSNAGKVRFLLDYAPDLAEIEIPDPYYGGPTGFERTMDLAEEACRGLFEDIRKQHLESRV